MAGKRNGVAMLVKGALLVCKAGDLFHDEIVDVLTPTERAAFETLLTACRAFEDLFPLTR